MTITQIIKKKGRRYQIYLDGEPLGEFDYDTLVLCGVQVGLSCNEGFIANLQETEERRRAKERALYLLEYRDHSREELIQKLTRSVSRQVAEDTADLMEELGFLDDTRYAQKLAKQLLLEKKQGRRQAIYQLRCKGVSPRLAEEAVNEIEVDPIEQILALLQRKYPDATRDAAAQRRAVAAMARRGYAYDEIYTAMRRFREAMEEEDE